jgi:hypothetical protein
VSRGVGNLLNPKIARHITADFPPSRHHGLFIWTGVGRTLVSDLPMDLELALAVAIGEKWGMPNLREPKSETWLDGWRGPTNLSPGLCPTDVTPVRDAAVGSRHPSRKAYLGFVKLSLRDLLKHADI